MCIIGAGDDFLYEHFVSDLFPGVTVVTADCFMFDKPVTRKFPDGKGTIIILPICLTGASAAHNTRTVL